MSTSWATSAAGRRRAYEAYVQSAASEVELRVDCESGAKESIDRIKAIRRGS